MDAVVNLCDRHAQEKDVTVKSDTQGIPWYNENTYALIAEKKIEPWCMIEERETGKPRPH